MKILFINNFAIKLFNYSPFHKHYHIINSINNNNNNKCENYYHFKRIKNLK